MSSTARSIDAKSPVLLRNYRAPYWHITDVELAFDLGLRETIVEARLTIKTDQARSRMALQLDGDAGLELFDICLDGQSLSAEEYVRDDEGLTILNAPAACVLETRVRLRPEQNKALQGLYLSGSHEAGFLLTQCEAEGFRRITFFTDRPDVLARYTVTLRADKQRFPVLLANGNPAGKGELTDGRHWARFVDPHPKPSYLFALVAGQLERIEDSFITAETRKVQLIVHAQADVINRCYYAMECLKAAMRWDEQHFGRCYDLDVFHIVATHDFTMGAMENKGLNIFNSSYLVADPDHATGDDYRHILAVVGHEYFHNWTGNRVTCRDWFQLSLKEGLTVYRDQEFESDQISCTQRRIDDVRALWRAQFPEDSGPLAHAVRPEQYSEINNFYTATVYNKGAEVVRMLATLLGKEGFRRGLDLYFMRHDGQAVTVEDFLKALGDANQRDLSDWLIWYNQAGTPTLTATGRYDERARCYELTLAQHTLPTPNQPYKQTLPIPVSLALFGAQGQALPLRLDGELQVGSGERVLLLTEESVTYRFRNVLENPVASLLRGYSAPVKLEQNLAADDLALLIRHDSDGFNRWFAADTLLRRLFTTRLAGGAADSRELVCWTVSLSKALADTSLDCALVAELLTLPAEPELIDGLSDIDPEAVHRIHNELEMALGRALQPALLLRYTGLSHIHPRDEDPAHQASRRLRNRCLALLSKIDAQHLELARQQFASATNLTDRLSALTCLVHNNAMDADDSVVAFAQRYANDPIVLDKWFSVQATCPHPDTLPRVEVLTTHMAFRWENPNKVYALLVAFAKRNLRNFHRADGAGYRFVAEAIVKLDALNPQVAARLATSFGAWHQYESRRRALMQAELNRLLTQPGLSRDLADIVARSLAVR